MALTDGEARVVVVDADVKMAAVAVAWTKGDKSVRKQDKTL